MNDSGYDNVLFALHEYQRKHLSMNQVLEALGHWDFSKDRSLPDVINELAAANQHRATAAYVRDEPSSDSESGKIDSIGTVEHDVSKITDTRAEQSLYGRAIAEQTQHGHNATTHSTGSSAAHDERFEVKNLIASGGLGEVFLAQDKEVRRDIALKCIREKYADNDHFQAKFKQETEITGRLEHPHIIPIYGAGKSIEGRPYYAMRLIEGANLRDETKQFHESGGRTERDSADFRRLLLHFVDVCNAIDYAHSRNVIHRDIKPNNIMLGKFGETYVVDWGLAKVLGEEDSDEHESVQLSIDTEATRRGSEIGTRGYMAPEQALGNVDVVGKASDIYGLGATLYAVLTDRAPIDNRTDTEAYLENVRSGTFSQPTVLNPNTPKPLEAICLKALAAEPTSRYPSARAIAADVEAWLADEKVSSYSESAPESLGRWGRSNVALILAGIAGLAMATAALAFAAYGIQKASRRDQLAINHLEKGVYQCRDGLVDRGLLDLSQAVAIAKPNSKIHDAANEQLHAWLGELEFRMPHADPILAMASMDGSTICTFSKDGMLGLWNAKSQILERKSQLTEKFEPLAASEFLTAAFSPDGTRLACVHHRDGVLNATFWDTVTDKRVGGDLADDFASVIKLPGAANIRHNTPLSTVWLDSHNVGFCFNPDQFVIYNTNDLAVRKVQLGHRSGLAALAVSKNGKLVLSCGRIDGWKLWDVSQLLDSSNATPSPRCGGALPGMSVATAVAVSSSASTPHVWIATRSSPLRKRKEYSVTHWQVDQDGTQGKGSPAGITHESPIAVLDAVSRNGTTRLVSGGNDRTLKWWTTVGGEGQLTDRQRLDMAISNTFLADIGTLVGCKDGLARLFYAPWTTTPLPANPTMVGASTDAEVLAVGFDSGEVSVYSTASSRPTLRAQLPANDSRARVTSVSVDPAGKLLLVAAQKSNQVTRPDDCPSVVQLWNIASEPPQKVGQDIETDSIVFGTAFHPNEPVFATVGAGKVIQLRDSSSCRVIDSIPSDSWMTSVKFNSAGNRICVGLVEDVARVYDLATKESTELPHRKVVDTVAFGYSNGEEIVATGSFDNTVEVWNQENDRLLTPLIHDRKLLRIRFDPTDRNTLYSLTKGGVFRRWNATNGTLTGAAKRITAVGKDLCVTQSCVALIGENDRNLYTTRQGVTSSDQANIVKRSGWKSTSVGQRQVPRDEWIQQFTPKAK